MEPCTTNVHSPSTPSRSARPEDSKPIISRAGLRGTITVTGGDERGEVERRTMPFAFC